MAGRSLGAKLVVNHLAMSESLTWRASLQRRFKLNLTSSFVPGKWWSRRSRQPIQMSCVGPFRLRQLLGPPQNFGALPRLHRMRIPPFLQTHGRPFSICGKAFAPEETHERKRAA
jgi:hypothetical protein